MREEFSNRVLHYGRELPLRYNAVVSLCAHNLCGADVTRGNARIPRP